MARRVLDAASRLGVGIWGWWGAVFEARPPLPGPARSPAGTTVIVLSFRPNDADLAAGRIYGHLERRFAPGQVRSEVDVPPGEAFVRGLEAQVRDSGVVVAVVGPRWLTIRDPWGRRPLERQDDPVRVQLEAALRHQKRIMVVLVGGAKAPAGFDLPVYLRPLATGEPLRVRDERFRADVEGLVDAVATALAAAAPADHQRVPPGRALLIASHDTVVDVVRRRHGPKVMDTESDGGSGAGE